MNDIINKLVANNKNYSAGECGKAEKPMPSIDALTKVVDIARSILFPGYFGNPHVNSKTLQKHLTKQFIDLEQILSEQIYSGLCFGTFDNDKDAQKSKAEELAQEFMKKLPELQSVLGTDVEAAYIGDPAAKSRDEIIFCYPAIRAIINYRIAHELLLLGIPTIPRIITEMAHSETGIDIHPGATIGSYFTIDHGTGVVIGETAILGNNVKLYQGVTLGAKSFPLDENGNPIKGIPRHPIIEDNVIIYSNSTILGRITIGRDAIIGGNMWVDKDVAVGAKITQR